MTVSSSSGTGPASTTIGTTTGSSSASGTTRDALSSAQIGFHPHMDLVERRACIQPPFGAPDAADPPTEIGQHHLAQPVAVVRRSPSGGRSHRRIRRLRDSAPESPDARCRDLRGRTIRRPAGGRPSPCSREPSSQHPRTVNPCRDRSARTLPMGHRSFAQEQIMPSGSETKNGPLCISHLHKGPALFCLATIMCG
jgi:hypothetical protein